MLLPNDNDERSTPIPHSVATVYIPVIWLFLSVLPSPKKSSEVLEVLPRYFVEYFLCFVVYCPYCIARFHLLQKYRLCYSIWYTDTPHTVVGTEY